MQTSLFEALDFDWNHSNDLLWKLKNQKLSLWHKISKLFADCIVYAFGYVMGAEDFGKLANKRIFMELKNNYEKFIQEDPWITKGTPIILVLNGENHIPTSIKTFQQLEEQSNYKIQFIKVHKLSQILESVDSLKQFFPIKALWIRAHGTPNTISFKTNPYCPSEGEVLNITPMVDTDDIYRKTQIENTRTFIQKLCENLEKDAPIILESCSTGQLLPEGKENIAQFIANEANGRKVYAPSEEALPIDQTISYSTEAGFKVNIKGILPATGFPKGSLCARLIAVWNAFKGKEIDITREFISKSNSIKKSS